MPELLLPAGSMETLKTAVRYGADAVYLGGREFSLRARAHNFDLPELFEAVRYAHTHGVRAYVTANVFARDEELKAAGAFFRSLAQADAESRPDALLVADPGMLVTARANCPDIPLHLSTQANTVNAAACRFWAAQGVTRIVTARELSLDEIRALRGSSGDGGVRFPELECFVHGAMCISYSGKCLLSRAMTGRESNRGACAHPCRYRYALVEEKRPGEYYPIEEDDAGTEILAAQDLCMLERLPALAAAGVDSCKVEGRMRNALYVATVGRAYRRGLDLLAMDPEGDAFRRAAAGLLAEVLAVATRDLSTGFYLAEPVLYACPDKQRVFLGVAKTPDPSDRTVGFCVEQRNRISVGDTIYAMQPWGRDGGSAQTARLSDGENSCAAGAVTPDPPLTVTEILDEEGRSIREAVHPKERVRVFVEGGTVCAGDVLYRI